MWYFFLGFIVGVWARYFVEKHTRSKQLEQQPSPHAGVPVTPRDWESKDEAKATEIGGSW